MLLPTSMPMKHPAGTGGALLSRGTSAAPWQQVALLTQQRAEEDCCSTKLVMHVSILQQPVAHVCANEAQCSPKEGSADDARIRHSWCLSGASCLYGLKDLQVHLSCSRTTGTGGLTRVVSAPATSCSKIWSGQCGILKQARHTDAVSVSCTKSGSSAACCSRAAAASSTQPCSQSDRELSLVVVHRRTQQLRLACEACSLSGAAVCFPLDPGRRGHQQLSTWACQSAVC